MSEPPQGYEAQLDLYSAELERLVRRLRGFSAAAWRSRSEVVAATLADLVVIEAGITGADRPSMPPLPDYGLADAAAVIGADVYDALAHDHDEDRLREALSVLRSTLERTR